MTSHSYIFTPRRVPYNYQTVPEALEERAKETPDHVILGTLGESCRLTSRLSPF